MEVLSDRQHREHVLHLRDEVHPRRVGPVGAQARHVLAVEPNGAGARLDEPVYRLEERRLPGAVRPNDRDDLLGIGLDRDPAEDQRVVVARCQILNLRRAARSMRPSEVGIDDLLVRSHLVGSADDGTRPWFITTTRSAARMTKSRSCSTIRNVMPLSRRIARICSSSWVRSAG